MVDQNVVSKVESLKKEIDGILECIEWRMSEVFNDLEGHPEPECYPKTLEEIKRLLVEVASHQGIAL